MSRGKISLPAADPKLSTRTFEQLEALQAASTPQGKTTGAADLSGKLGISSFLQELASQGQVAPLAAFLGTQFNRTTGAFQGRDTANRVADSLRGIASKNREKENLELEFLKKQLASTGRGRTTGGGFGAGAPQSTRGQQRSDDLRRRNLDLRDLAKAAEIQRMSELDALGKKIALLKGVLGSFQGGDFGTETVTQETIFNNAGRPQVVPLKTTRRDNSALVERLLGILG